MTAKNQNGRVYPKNLLMRSSKNTQKTLFNKKTLGELDHPDSSVVNLQVNHTMY